MPVKMYFYFSDFIKILILDGSPHYRNRLLAMMIPEISILAIGKHFVFQQDGGRAHTAKDTEAYPNINVPEYISPENWPPNSPYLNPVDFSIWGNL